MLMANVCVAKEYYFKKIPFLYRIHERPKDEKISELNSYLRPLGYMINFDEKVEPRDVQKVLEKAKGTKEEMFISTMTLRLSLIHISEPTRRTERSRMPSSA